MNTEPINVVGIDVGGLRKGFHAVALSNGEYRGHRKFAEISDLVRWSVEEVGAQMIAVDAPCGWSKDGRARPAELQLMRNNIWCFATPTEEAAKKRKAQAERGETTNHFGWMLRGAELYDAIKATHPVLGRMPQENERCCIETYPHAITWHLRGGNANANEKRPQRSVLLRGKDIKFPANKTKVSIDFIDAALCALTASMVTKGERMVSYGESQTGLIIVPALHESVPKTALE